MSNAKLGLLTFWPTFWTGFPIKMAFALLLLAGHVHPWEGSGLFMLLLVSIPVDIWALGLCARTVFIDRLKVDPQPGLGLKLWIRWAAFSAVALPGIKIVVSAVADGVKSAVHSTVESFKESLYPTLPVAEQITLELVLWGSVASVVLLVLVYAWLYGLGWLTQPFVRAATPVDENVEERTHFWDKLRIPSDQPLLLTAFTGVGVVLVFVFWGLLPVSTPHPHAEYEFINPPKEIVRVDPSKVLAETEQVVLQAELTVEKLEKEKAEGGAEEASGKDAPGGAKNDAKNPKAEASPSSAPEEQASK
ncbi:MAG: hypothetical protein AB7P17_10120 [Nitrospirales bacterium]|nr:hypothetical protein [Nitrospirales bacterium]